MSAVFRHFFRDTTFLKENGSWAHTFLQWPDDMRSHFLVFSVQLTVEFSSWAKNTPCSNSIFSPIFRRERRYCAPKNADGSSEKSGFFRKFPDFPGFWGYHLMLSQWFWTLGIFPDNKMFLFETGHPREKADGWVVVDTESYYEYYLMYTSEKCWAVQVHIQNFCVIHITSPIERWSQ